MNCFNKNDNTPKVFRYNYGQMNIQHGPCSFEIARCKISCNVMVSSHCVPDLYRAHEAWPSIDHISNMAQQLGDFAKRFGSGAPKGLGLGLKLLIGAGAVGYGIKESVYTGNDNIFMSDLVRIKRVGGGC